MAWRRGRAYGQDLRDRVLAAADLSLRAAAARFAVSPSYVSKVRARLRDTGEATPGPQRNHVPPRLAPLADAPRARVAAGADASLAESRGWALARLGLTLKKTAARGRAGPRRRRQGAARLGGSRAQAGPGQAGVRR